MTIPPPSTDLVRAYREWSGTEDRYPGALPPHLFSQWALPAAVRVLEQTRYALAGVVNQGVDMRVNGPLPTGQPLLVTARLHSLVEAGGRARVAVEIHSGPAAQPDAVVSTLHLSFVIGRPEKKTHRDESDSVAWQTLGQWRAAGDDGLRFALLTGDFNPIHWLGVAGRLSPFKQKVLHGFGMFVRSYEVLARESPIDEIEVRLLKPVPLPSAALSVQVAPTQVDAEGWVPLRLRGVQDQLHLAGRYRATAKSQHAPA